MFAIDYCKSKTGKRNGSLNDAWWFFGNHFFWIRFILRHIIALSFTIAFSFILSYPQLEEMLMDVSLIPVFLSSGCSWSIGRRSYLVTLKSQNPQSGSVKLLGIQRVSPYISTWNPKQPIFMVPIGWWTKPLLGKFFHQGQPCKTGWPWASRRFFHGSQVLSICIHLVFMALAKSGTPTLVGQKLGPLGKRCRWKQPTFGGTVWLRCCFRLSSSVYIGVSMHLGEIEMLHDCFTYVFSSRLHPDVLLNWSAQLVTLCNSYIEMWRLKLTLKTEVFQMVLVIKQAGQMRSFYKANRWVFTTVCQLVGSTPYQGFQWQLSNKGL